MLESKNSLLLLPLLACLASCSAGGLESRVPPQSQTPAVPEQQTRGEQPAPVPMPSPVAPWNTEEWTLEFRGDCGEGMDKTCPFAYGLQIRSDGSYIVGPADDGQLLSGWVSEEELQSLRQRFQASDRLRQESSCTVAKGIHNAAGMEIRLLNSESIRCEEAREKSETPWDGDVQGLSRIGLTYYPEAFPNPCSDAAWDYRKELGKIQRCEQDSDCVLIGPDLLPLATDAAGIAVAAGCEHFPDFEVANGFEAVVHQGDLLLRRDLAQRICDKHAQGRFCSHPRKTDLQSSPPRCTAGKCELFGKKKG